VGVRHKSTCKNYIFVYGKQTGNCATSTPYPPVQQSPKGYQLVEDDFTTAIVNYPAEHLPGMVLAWFVDLLRREPAIAGLPVEIELITAQYVSKYPCIAIHYLTPNSDDIEPLILSLLATYRESRTFGEFHQFLLTHAVELTACKQKFEQTLPVEPIG
jgi:hypothetical protein